MKSFIFFFSFIVTVSVFSQANLSGTWQGVLFRDGLKDSESLIFYVDLTFSGKEISGKTRQESYNSDFYAIQKIKGTRIDNKIEFKENVIIDKKASSKINWCSSDFIGELVDSTGYISGTYKSSTCKRVAGKFILYRSKTKFSETVIPSLGHAWRDVFLMDLKFGRKAPEIRDKERENFKFQPIYFDHDKTEIKLEFQAYLLEMIRVVNGHSDLRIQVTGHTDADGSEIYNQDLSRRRAKSIEVFFNANGLELKKLQIDFKGESEPIDNNKTEAGKKLNRRVDFKFI